MKHRSRQPAEEARARRGGRQTPSVRIIGGKLRGSKLIYDGHPRTRPMKDRLREAVFDLLGPSVRGKVVVDLFAGTGALGLEALSRGAKRAVLIERHFPTAELLRANAANLKIERDVEVVASDTFFWARDPQLPETDAWLVFCSPPYEFYASRGEEMIALVRTLIDRAPEGSIFAVEADSRLDFEHMPRAGQWNVRQYGSAQVGILRLENT